MQGTQVPSLAWEDPTCRGATDHARSNYSGCALRLLKSTCPGARALRQGKPLPWEARAPQRSRARAPQQPESSRAEQQRPRAAGRGRVLQRDLWTPSSVLGTVLYSLDSRK